jgi:hypothetical protein
MKSILLLVIVFISLSASRVLADDIKIWPLFYQNTDSETDTVRTELLWPLYVRDTRADMDPDRHARGSWWEQEKGGIYAVAGIE